MRVLERKGYVKTHAREPRLRLPADAPGAAGPALDGPRVRRSRVQRVRAAAARAPGRGPPLSSEGTRGAGAPHPRGRVMDALAVGQPPGLGAPGRRRRAGGRAAAAAARAVVAAGAHGVSGGSCSSRACCCRCCSRGSCSPAPARRRRAGGGGARRMSSGGSPSASPAAPPRARRARSAVLDDGPVVVAVALAAVLVAGVLLRLGWLGLGLITRRAPAPLGARRSGRGPRRSTAPRRWPRPTPSSSCRPTASRPVTCGCSAPVVLVPRNFESFPGARADGHRLPRAAARQPGRLDAER